MYGYLFRRLLGTIPVLLVVAVFIFLMLRLTPSDPAAIIAGDNATTEQVAKIRSQLGLDRPDGRAVLHLVRQGPDRRSRRELLLQEDRRFR